MQRVAMRVDGTLYYLLTDHAAISLSTGLGSTSVTTDAGGNKIAELRLLCTLSRKGKASESLKHQDGKSHFNFCLVLKLGC